jgi:hypothetical protein
VERQENTHGNKEALCCFPIQKIHEGHTPGRPVPQFLLRSVENCKMVRKVVLYLLNCVFFNAFFVYRTLNTNKIKYKNFLHEVGRSWISAVQNQSESNSDLQSPEKQTTPRGP